MRITYFSYLWDIEGISAGSAIKAIEFLEAIRQQGHEVFLEWRVQQPKKNGTAGNVNRTSKKHLEKYLKEPKRLLSNFKYLVEERRILKTQKPDIFFPRLSYGNFSCALLSKWMKLPTIVEADCPPTHEWEEFYGKEDFKFGDLSLNLEIALLNQADAVITQSNQLSQYYIERGIPAEKITMIPNAADIEKFQPKTKDPALNRRFALDGKIVIGWVGAGISWTGVDVLREVFNEIMEKYPTVHFMMLGSPENTQFFQENFCKNGKGNRFILPGFVPHNDVPKYLSCMDIVLAPYPKFDFFYASSMKLFEYMASGKAIVATRVGQVAEVIKEGENGFLFDPEESRSLYDQIVRLVESETLRKKFGLNARKNAETEFNWKQVGRKMIDVFDDVLKRRVEN